jgi:RND family efflux transporter MFP subunit
VASAGLRVYPILAATILLHACNRTPSLPPSGSGSTVDASVEVQTSALRLGSISQVVSASGSVVARRESHIGAEVSGRIVRVHVVEGDRVEAGASLFDVDPMPYEIALRQGRAVLDVASAERRQVEADLQRAKALRRQNVLAEQEIERLTTTLAVAQARERQATEAVALALHNLERTRVKAPFAASIAARLADEGSTALVQPQTIVVVLQETAELEARAAIPESQIPLVSVGDRALIRVEGMPDPIETRVSAVNDTIDPATRTYLVKMPVPNPDHGIKAGVFAHVEIFPGGRAGMVLAPRESIRVEDGRARLLLARNGEVVLVPVDVGAASQDEVEILSGASAGETAIVGDAVRTLAPGMRVRPGKPAAVS